MLKRALSSISSPSSDDLVHARDLDAEERSTITSLSIQIAGSGSGKILNEFHDDLPSTCYHVTRPTLTRWRTDYLQDTNCIHDAYGVGRLKVLGADGKNAHDGICAPQRRVERTPVVSRHPRISRPGIGHLQSHQLSPALLRCQRPLKSGCQGPFSLTSSDFCSPTSVIGLGVH